MGVENLEGVGVGWTGVGGWGGRIVRGASQLSCFIVLSAVPARGALPALFCVSSIVISTARVHTDVCSSIGVKVCPPKHRHAVLCASVWQSLTASPAGLSGLAG